MKAASKIPKTVLLIENDPVAAENILRSVIKRSGARSNGHGEIINADNNDEASEKFSMVWVRTLSDATDLLALRNVDAILLNLNLPSCRGIDAVTSVLEEAPDTPILILCYIDEVEMAHRAVRRGAEDYLLFCQLNSDRLQRHIDLLLSRKAAPKLTLDRDSYFRKICDGSPLGIYVLDDAGKCVYSNIAYQQILGAIVEDTAGENLSIPIHADDKRRALADCENAMRKGMPSQSEIRYLRQDDSVVWARFNTAAMYAGTALTGYIQTVEDITERKLKEFRTQDAEDALFIEKERAQVTLNSIGDAVVATDNECRVSYMNKVAEEMTGWSSAEAMGRPLANVLQLIDGESRTAAPNPADIVIAEDRIVELSANSLLIRKDGSECHIEDSAAPIHSREGKVTGAVIVFHDVGLSKTITSKMSHMAQHDALTGLPNRTMLGERLAQAIGLAHRHQKLLGLMYVDLDMFKHVNDTLGHTIGDRLLQSAAKRLSGCLRSTDTVCRQGGDEFVILLLNLEHQQDATLIAENLLAAFGRPHSIDAHQLYITLSIGITIFPDDGKTVDAMMQNADIAMYHAKANGRNNYQFFKEEMNQRAVSRLLVIEGLQRALKRHEFELYYQPKFNLESGGVTGLEALLRWNDPEMGLLTPDRFIAIAEESGLIVDIGRWILGEVCRQIKQWQDAGHSVVPIAVNISAVQYGHKNFLAGVASALRISGIESDYLELEFTENILMHDTQKSIAVLDALKVMGVKVTVDGFGTGYSSLNYLKLFQLNSLKIDQSFVRDVPSEAGDASIVSAIIDIGKNLKLKVSAEGVETEQQLEFLKARHCEEGQGDFLSYPLTAIDFGRLLTVSTPCMALPIPQTDAYSGNGNIPR